MQQQPEIHTVYGPYGEIKKFNECNINNIKIIRNTFFINKNGAIFYGSICETKYSLNDFIFIYFF
jgi:hypothetical protein